MTTEPAPANWPKGTGRPATNAPLNIGVERLEDLARYSDRELPALHGVGPKAIRVLRAALARRRPGFRDSVVEPALTRAPVR